MKKTKSGVKTFFYENKEGKIIPVDDVNVEMIKKMLNDPTISDYVLSTELKISPTNVDRRRKIIEDNFLTKNYLLDVSALGWRLGDINVDVGKGKSEELAEQIFRICPNILDISLRINSTATVSARIFYRNTQELDSILEKIKSLPFVKDVHFSEIIKMVRTRSIGTMKEIFAVRVRTGKSTSEAKA